MTAQPHKAARKCAFTSCPKEIPTNLFMCPAHWSRVPAGNQKAVYRAFREWGRRPTLENGRALREVQAAAVRVLEEAGVA